jgi:hypothetical protein
VLYAAPRDCPRRWRRCVRPRRRFQAYPDAPPATGVSGLALLDWAGTPVFGHDGDMPGQSSAWWVIPDHRLVVALSVNANAVRGIFDEVVVPIVEELTGVPVPARPAPPRPVPPSSAGGGKDHGRLAGRYVTPLYEYEVAAADGGLAITTTPKGIAAAVGQEPRTDRSVALPGDTYVTAEPEDGFHETVTFVHDGQYLHTMRAAPGPADRRLIHRRAILGLSGLSVSSSGVMPPVSLFQPDDGRRSHLWAVPACRWST